jgi:hypothetical protein
LDSYIAGGWISSRMVSSSRPLKKVSSEAAASEKPRRTSYLYVEALSDARTKLGAFFSSRLKIPC